MTKDDSINNLSIIERQIADDEDLSQYKNKIIYLATPILSPIELDEKLESLSSEEKKGLIKLSHIIKPVVRFDFVKEYVHCYRTYYDTDESVTVYLTSCYDFEPTPQVISDNHLRNEFDERYMPGFFGYIKSGQNIFKNSFKNNIEFLCRAPKMEKIAEIATYHYYQRQFLPTEAEVLLQIPKPLLKQTNAYEIYLNDITPNEYITPDSEHIEATVRLFKFGGKRVEPVPVRKYFEKLDKENDLD